MREWMLFLPACAVLAASQAPHPPQLAFPVLAQAPSMAWDADLSTWGGALEMRDFGMIMPDDKGVNRWPTIAHLAWGPDALYVAVECLDPQPDQVRSTRHRRDDWNGDSDIVGLDIDPTGTGQSVLRLITDPQGGQWDAIVLDNTGEDYSYDCLWDSVGVRTPQGYLAKFRVPYSSLRRSPGQWRVRLLRIIPRERRFGIAWPAMSRDVQCDICQTAQVAGAPVDRPGAPFLIVPFAAFTRTQATETDPLASPENHTRLGLDTRYATTAMTLEATYRPDFNNVDADVDPLQINSRFKVFYPERRPFFLEGMDLMGVGGAQRQFFSRTVVDPLYGLKASGSSGGFTWSALNAKDQQGGLVLDANSANGVPPGLDELPSRDVVAALRYRLDERGSGLEVLGTDKLLLGGPQGSGGQSGGLYLDQHLGSEFHVMGSLISGLAHLPQPDGSLLVQRGEATSLELDWGNRHWYASAVSQATSPGLVLLSGFTDLQGYRKQSANVGWHENWNEGGLSQLSFTLWGRRLTWWDGQAMDQAMGIDAYVETPGRWSSWLTWVPLGRTWANDELQSNATRSLSAGVQWRKFAWAQLNASGWSGRTLDLDSGAPAHSHGWQAGWHGSTAGLSFNLYGQIAHLDRESDGVSLIRARELVLTATYQLPLYVYLRAQAFGVRYDGLEGQRNDNFLKAFVGYQPNAFTNCYLGWSGQRRRDPGNAIPEERMVERGLFAKLAYAIQF